MYHYVANQHTQGCTLLERMCVHGQDRTFAIDSQIADNRRWTLRNSDISMSLTQTTTATPQPSPSHAGVPAVDGAFW
jgi:hypothetical protein